MLPVDYCTVINRCSLARSNLIVGFLNTAFFAHFSSTKVSMVPIDVHLAIPRISAHPTFSVSIFVKRELACYIQYFQLLALPCQENLGVPQP